MELRGILKEGNIHKSHSRNPKYYLVESRYNIARLEKLRKSKVINMY